MSEAEHIGVQKRACLLLSVFLFNFNKGPASEDSMTLPPEAPTCTVGRWHAADKSTGNSQYGNRLNSRNHRYIIINVGEGVSAKPRLGEDCRGFKLPRAVQCHGIFRRGSLSSHVHIFGQYQMYIGVPHNILYAYALHFPLSTQVLTACKFPTHYLGLTRFL